MLKFPAYLFRTFPAASRAFAAAAALSLAVFVAARIHFRDARPLIFLVGDSGIGNYRLLPGERLEDALERKAPGARVINWAEPGATPLDFYLQYARGTLLAGRPKAVVIALEPAKFLSHACPHRLDDDGANLRWIPWSRAGLSLWTKLSPHERNVALVQQAGRPFFAAADAVQALWERYVQWPDERRRMLAGNVERRKRIERKSCERARGDEAAEIPDDGGFARLPLAQDARFLLEALRADGVETRVMLMPYGNPDLIRKTCSPAVLAKHDTVVVRMHRWLEAQAVAYLDFNSAADSAHFAGSAYDDLDHMKDPAAFAYMADRLRHSLAFSPALHLSFSLAVPEDASQDDRSSD
jgi:hypothetical protein